MTLIPVFVLNYVLVASYVKQKDLETKVHPGKKGPSRKKESIQEKLL